LSSFKEADFVAIPSDLALAAGVTPMGTIVWHVPEAPFATVECQVVADNPNGWVTELVDVPLERLTLIEAWTA